MRPPILFVDEKKIDDLYEYRFYELKRQLSDCEDVIEFMPDLDIIHSIDQYTETVKLESNPYLESREIIFMHVSQDNPKYSEVLYNALKASQPKTMFARFSGQGSLILNKESLRFKRAEHIYNSGTKGFQQAIRFYKYNQRFEPYILVYGNSAFLKKIEEAEKEFHWLKRNITNTETLRHYGANRNFTRIMSLANLDSSRIEKGKEHIKTIDIPSDYFALLERYVQQILVDSQRDNELLQALNL